MRFSGFFLIFGCLLPALSVAAETTVSQKSYEGVPKCDKPVVKVSIVEIACKTAACQAAATDSRVAGFLQGMSQISGNQSLADLSPGMTAMLTTAVSKSGCFEVLDRAMLLALKEEAQLAGRTFQGPTADYMLTGVITSASQDQKGFAVNTGMFGGLTNAFGVNVGTRKTIAKLGADFRLVDAKTGKVVKTYTYQAENGKSGFDIGATGMASIFGNVDFRSLEGTPWQEVTREIALMAVSDLARDLAPNAVFVSQKPSAGADASGDSPSDSDQVAAVDDLDDEEDGD